jgi:hypothetical protein
MFCHDHEHAIMLLTKYEIDVLTAVKTLIVAFWVVTPCSLIGCCKHSEVY